MTAHAYQITSLGPTWTKEQDTLRYTHRHREGGVESEGDRERESLI